MTKRGRKAQAPSKRAWLWAAAAFAVGAAVLAVAFAARDGATPGGSSSGRDAISGVPDLHGLAVSPENPSEVILATHTGLVRMTNDDKLQRFGSARDDYMGFSPHPADADTFWVSGHPASGGNLGVRVTRDGGESWEALGLPGVDFHAMTVSPVDTNRMWGFWAGGLQHSSDGGATWSRLAPPAEHVSALAADPRDASRVWAATAHGAFSSKDAGATWERVGPEMSLTTIALDRREAGTMYAAGSGGVLKSADGGATWARTPLEAAGQTIGHVAIDPSDSRVVYAGSYQGGVWKSSDAGGSWRIVLAPAR